MLSSHKTCFVQASGSPSDKETLTTEIAALLASDFPFFDDSLVISAPIDLDLHSTLLRTFTHRFNVLPACKLPTYEQLTKRAAKFAEQASEHDVVVLVYASSADSRVEVHTFIDLCGRPVGVMRAGVTRAAASGGRHDK